MASFDEALFDTLDFLHILGYPHQLDVEDDGRACFPMFCEYKYATSVHIWFFEEFLQAYNIIHEDLKMKLFVVFLDLSNNQDVKYWYKKFSPKGFPSFKHLIKAREGEHTMVEDVRQDSTDDI